MTDHTVASSLGQGFNKIADTPTVPAPTICFDTVQNSNFKDDIISITLEISGGSEQDADLTSAGVIVANLVTTISGLRSLHAVVNNAIFLLEPDITEIAPTE